MMINSYCLSKKPKRAIIALHGYTGNTSSMEPIAKSFNFTDTKWLIPEAPYKINISTDLNSEKYLDKFSWSNYTVRNKDTPQKKFVEKSIEIINQCIKILEDEGLNKSKIFILGFSQGAIFSLWYIINQNFSIGGCISISGGLDKSKEFIKNHFKAESKGTRILLLHGKKDKIILPIESKNTHNFFKEIGFDIKLKLFPIAHKIPLKAKTIIWSFLIQNESNF